MRDLGNTVPLELKFKLNLTIIMTVISDLLNEFKKKKYIGIE